MVYASATCINWAYRAVSLFVVLATATFASTRAEGAVVVDYAYDTFFAWNVNAKAALEAAVSDINSVITSHFSAISSAQDTVSGTSGSTTASFNHSFTFTNPTTGMATSYNGGNTAIAQNDIRVYVGMRSLGGTTLGQGGPGSVGFALSGSGFPSEWASAVDAAENASNAIYLRGGDGPVISEINGVSTFGPTTTTYTLQYGNSVGNLWFDNDSNNDGVADSAAMLDTYFQFDHTAPVASGKSDFYSVALHETLHSLGFGTSKSWSDQVAGTDWSGSNVTALLGSGSNVIQPDGSHIRSGLLSTTFNGGVSQESVMAPSIETGTRKYLTNLDVAFLRDLNFVTASPVPEPGSILLVSAIAVCIGRRAIAFRQLHEEVV